MTAFNPAKFSTSPRKTITIGNSAHPVLEHVVGVYLRRIPSKKERYENLFYVELANGKGVITYHDLDNTMQFHKCTLDEFKALVSADQPFNSEYEVVDCDKRNKYLGNDIMLILQDEELI